jgi:hypothetical protein
MQGDMRTIIAFAVIMALTGCASITGTKFQPISVKSVHDKQEVPGAVCSLVNAMGKWFVTTPGTVTVQKDTGDLAVDCHKDDVGIGMESVPSKANTSVWGNILMGGPVGYAVDRSTGAGFDYPSVITILLKKKSEPIKPEIPPTPEPVATAAPTPPPQAVSEPAPVEKPKEPVVKMVTETIPTPIPIPMPTTIAAPPTAAAADGSAQAPKPVVAMPRKPTSRWE